MSSKAAVKLIKRRKASKFHMNRPRSPEPAQCQYKIVRYKYRPKLPFAQERRLWCPVGHAWQIYTLDKYYHPRSSLSTSKKRGNRDVWRLAIVRSQAQVRKCCSSSTPWGTRASFLQFQPRKDLASSSCEWFQREGANGGASTAVVGEDMGNVDSRMALTLTANAWPYIFLPPSIRERGMASGLYRGPRVVASVQSVASTKETTSNRYVYGAILDQIYEEEIPESAPIVTELPTTTKTPIRSWGVAATKPTNTSTAQSLVTAMREPLVLRLRSRVDTQNPGAPPITRSIKSPLSSRKNYGARAPLYDFAKKSVQLAVDKSSRIRRSIVDSLKTACTARGTDITTFILPLYIEAEKIGAQLFKPCAIGDQSMATYRNPRKMSVPLSYETV
ncbi:hypothetical protein HOY82DRAFT_640990 [Tuber indicum]|nr:hypothetical protein HOY82DRAFT_640990 [Tuber indicum]